MERFDPHVYNAAIGRGEDIETSRLREYLEPVHVTRGKNTLLHLAAAAGNLKFVNRLLRFPNIKPEFIVAKNSNGNTALHEAAQGGHIEVVDALLIRHKDLGAIRNDLNQTALFKACEGGHSSTVKLLVVAEGISSSDFDDGGRTCLHVAAFRGDAGLLESLLIAVVGKDEDLVKAKDKEGNTVLHWAVRKNRKDMVKLLLDFQPELCYETDEKEDTPLCTAVKLGCFSIVKLLIAFRPDSIEIRNKDGKNVLHLAVEFRRVEIVKFLTEEVDLSQLINQPDQFFMDEKQSPLQDRGTDKDKDHSKKVDDKQCPLQDRGTDKDKDHSKKVKKEQPKYLGKGGNTPLHIAVTIKNNHMVKLLLNVHGVNKGARNEEGFTPLDIARENTEYHESFKIIAKLVDYPQRRRPFLYSAPTVSSEKHEKALENLHTVFSQRRDTELVVSVLLATIAFTAAFTVPGGFNSDPTSSNAPLLIRYASFKLFLIFDCVAFFLSLLVALIWTISSPLTTDDPMLLMSTTAPVLCLAFAFVCYAFMSGVYAAVAHQVWTLAWVILASSISIASLGHLAILYVLGKVLVRRARFHRLCGVACVLDDIVEFLWIRAERVGFLNFIRYCGEKITALLTGHHDHSVRHCGRKITALLTGHRDHSVRSKGERKKRPRNPDAWAKFHSGHVANCPSSSCSPELGKSECQDRV